MLYNIHIVILHSYIDEFFFDLFIELPIMCFFYKYTHYVLIQ